MIDRWTIFVDLNQTIVKSVIFYFLFDSVILHFVKVRIEMVTTTIPIVIVRYTPRQSGSGRREYSGIWWTMLVKR